MTSVIEVYRWLASNGYTLGVETRFEDHTTYADKLVIEGHQEPPPEIMAALRQRTYRDELLAVACVVDPPVPWLAELLRRHKSGYEYVWESRKEADGKSPLVTRISLKCLAANVAGFVKDSRRGSARSERFEPIIRAVLAPPGGEGVPQGARVVNIRSGAPFDVYIGRENGRYRLKRSVWHNPFRIDAGKTKRGGTLEEVLQKFARYVYESPALLARLPELRGKTLACWCAPEDGSPLTLEDPVVCHGQVLLKLLGERPSAKPETEAFLAHAVGRDRGECA